LGKRQIDNTDSVGLCAMTQMFVPLSNDAAAISLRSRKPEQTSSAISMSKRTPLIAGNWKLNTSRESGEQLAKVIGDGIADLACSVLVCPPFPYVAGISQAAASTRLTVGAQNVAAEATGAFTGEVAGAMLAELGARYAIVGHSERRSLFAETDADVGARTRGALDASLTPIVCVGETQQERESDQVDQVIARQLEAVRDVVGIDSFEKLVIAYEPVWAIGTGLTATPEQAQAVHAMIRQWVAGQGSATADALLILYGGSMKPGNAAELLAQPDIDGGLIGGAALVAEDFLAICRAAG
jgi:triosephosphate isomerase